MITPDDIQNKEFSKVMRGYKEDEVDEFLDQITLDYEQLITQYQELRSQLADANARLEEYKATEGAVLKTLESAKALMNDIAASAEKRAEILVKNAELDAELKQRQAREAVERLREEEVSLSQKVSTMKTRFRALLENELQRIDDISEQIFGRDYPVKNASESIVKTADFLAGADTAAKQNQDLSRTITNVRSE